MGLAMESQTQGNAEIDRRIAEAQARGTAKALAQAMVLRERNPDPHPERNVPNPASEFTRIRVVRPRRICIVTVDEETKRHNSMVQNLGKP